MYASTVPTGKHPWGIQQKLSHYNFLSYYPTASQARAYDDEKLLRVWIFMQRERFVQSLEAIQIACEIMNLCRNVCFLQISACTVTEFSRPKVIQECHGMSENSSICWLCCMAWREDLPALRELFSGLQHHLHYTHMIIIIIVHAVYTCLRRMSSSSVRLYNMP